MKIKHFAAVLMSSFLLASCFKDMDDTLQTATSLDIQNFVYRGLNYYYLYKEDTPELANNAFVNDTERNNFLKTYDSPESLFAYLKSSQDRFSNLFDDYNVIENALNGISLSNGMEYGLVYYPDGSGNVFGYVRYILPNTDAEDKELKRGDIFTTIDGQQLNDNNYQELLSTESYTIGLATYNGTEFLPTGETVQLIKNQYTENPVYKATTLDVNGRKIGYLMYNSFTKNYDVELNNAFGEFQAEGVTDLVLDLRYNGGGSVETATDLASMITGQFDGELFYQEFWNEDRQDERAENGLFDNKISNGSNTNSLNLNKVYILTTKRSASASELVLNGLDPYINTVQIGDTTTGKFQASFLLYDAPAPSFSKQLSDPSHTYCMLPLVFKTANKNGHTDFIDGLAPDIYLKENYFNLGQLGDLNEPLLAQALQEIAGRPAPLQKNEIELNEFTDGKVGSPIYGRMIEN
ncbi:S41 family peptidase [Aequorivita sinensis]|uniref:S41 family peptidase n=1 Tax=Aequorivita sinensis TaxID=1382458 RepID=UPI00111F8F60|nr:S41 family peptidase [Aequorivita sinensis]